MSLYVIFKPIVVFEVSIKTPVAGICQNLSKQRVSHSNLHDLITQNNIIHKILIIDLVAATKVLIIGSKNLESTPFLYFFHIYEVLKHKTLEKILKFRVCIKI